MGKKRRKSASGAGKEEEQPKKKLASEQGPAVLTWRGDGVRAVLGSDQALLFLGRGWLTVSTGALLVQGKVVQPGDEAVELCGDERAGGALLMEPLVADLQVPRVSDGADVSLTITSSCPSNAAAAGAEGGHAAAAQAPAGAAGAGGAGQPTFSLHLADDPAAPRLLPFGAEWQQAVVEVVESVAQGAPGAPAVIVVCGSKKVGKSTFARHLVNSLLNQHPAVAFLDTDCGQTEFTPPGLVSLSILTRPVLGPPHMHMRPPAAAYFVGDLSPASDPLAYLQHVRELYGWYCRHAAAAVGAAAAGGAGAAAGCCGVPGLLPPLVVNTHGWVKGLGFDVLVELLQCLQPLTHFVQLCAPNPHKNLPEGVFWAPAQAEPGATIIVPAPPLMWQLPALGGGGAEAGPAASCVSQSSAKNTGIATAAAAGGDEGGGRGGRALAPVETRAMQWAAFAQQCLEAMQQQGPASGVDQQARAAAGQQQGQQQAGSLAGYQLSAAELADGLAALVPWEVSMDDVNVQVLHSAVPPSQLPHALNGSLVALCGPSEEAGGKLDGSVASSFDSGRMGEPGPPSAPCLGLGIVRSVDARRRLLHILTPLDEQALERVTQVQLGKLELPSSLLQSGAHLSPYLCLFSLATMGTGAGVIKSRNNLMRQSQL